jgi:uncharacterized membrane protein
MSEREVVGQRWATARVEAFSDGVFAIAITLLVLDIHIEPSEFDHLWSALGKEWPAYLAYATSFLTVAAVWLAHHGLFLRLRWVDPVLMRLNLLVLMVAAFLPFPTGLLAASFHAPREAQHAAVVVYGIAAGLIEALLAAASRYAAAHPELLHEEHRTTTMPRTTAHRSAIGTALYAVAILAGIFIAPRITAVAYLAVAIRGVMLGGQEGGLTFGSRRAPERDAPRVPVSRRSRP